MIDPTTTPPPARRYDVDWLRTLALALLIVYHSVISFQSWGWQFGFPVNQPPLDPLWLIMALVNVWRIPLLFMVAGMGVRFALRRRTGRQLLRERAVRILLPYLFGLFTMGPLVTWLGTRYYAASAPPFVYAPAAAHLWFLLNIFVYTAALLPLWLWLRRPPDNGVLQFVRRVLARPGGVFLFALPLLLEGALVRPETYVTYVGTLHGWTLGLVCFALGFVFASVPDAFWPALERQWGALLLVAFALYTVRLVAFTLEGPAALQGVESLCWTLGLFGAAAVALNRPSPALSFLNTAVYPAYIVHLPLQYALALLLFRLPLPAELKLLLMMLGVFSLSLLFYLLIRPLVGLRVLFGLRP